MAYRNQDSWSSDFSYLSDLAYQIELKIKERNRRTGAIHHDREVSNMVDSLDEGLRELCQKRLRSSLSDYEMAARKRDLEDLTKRLEGFRRSLALSSNAFNDEEDVIYSQPHATRVGPGMGHRMTAEEIKQQQDRIIKEQDAGLDAISQALRRQQRIGITIQDEVTEHNVIIDDITRGTSRADARIQRETQRIEQRRRKEKTWWTCGLWTTIIVLILIIIIIAVVPFQGKP